MKWSFDSLNGGVTVRQEGEKAICQAISGSGGAGLCKAWLHGPTEKVLLGTLIPEGGALRLRRILEIPQLEQKGAWPPTGAEIVSQGEGSPLSSHPEGWQWIDRPGTLVGDREVAQMLQRTGRALYRKTEQGFFLALPYMPGEPFPLPALFCLSTLEQISGRWYVLFFFSAHGYPQLMYNSPAAGENRQGT